MDYTGRSGARESVARPDHPDENSMRRQPRHQRPRPVFDHLEVRALLSVDLDAGGAWPLRAPDGQTGVIVRFADDATDGQIGAALNPLSAYRAGDVPGGSTLLALGQGVDRNYALAALRASPGVVAAEADATIQASAVTPNDPRFGSLWGLNQANNVDIDAPEAWQYTTGSPATIVAVIDTGLDFTHPDLASKIYVNAGEIPGNGIDDDRNGFLDDTSGWNFVNGTNNNRDDNGHGTHVSGTLAAVGNNGVGVVGVNWNARIMVLKILDSRGRGSVRAATESIYYAVAQGAKVINASWGGGEFAQSLLDAIRYANSRGVVFVAAAGNQGSNDDRVPEYPASYRLPGMLSVAAVDRSGNIPRYSNYGAGTVDVAAPGDSILSALPGTYGLLSGTSMAAPYVSGVVALLAGAHPDWTAEQLTHAVRLTVKPLPSLAGRTITGGIVSAGRVLAAFPPAPGTGSGGIAALSAGSSTDDAVRAALLASDEYDLRHGSTPEGFLDGLYRDVLGRGVDPGGRSTWTGLLGSGTPRGEVVAAIQASPEATRVKVARWFRDDLDRTATLDQLIADPGVIALAVVLDAGGSDDAVRAVILGSDEYYARQGENVPGFLIGLYRDVLGRPIDPSGSATWANAAGSGASRGAIFRAIVDSDEGRRVKVARWYQSDLGRASSLDSLISDPGVSTWAGLLSST